MKDNTKKRLIVCVADGDSINSSYIKFLEKRFDVTAYTLSEIKKEKNYSSNLVLMLFTGGEDVNPSLYDEKVNNKTYYNEKRDALDSQLFDYFGRYIPSLGICRGSQFLTVNAGGKLIQHVNNHNNVGEHLIFNNLYYNKFMMTSTHHQMMYPFDLDPNHYELIAYSDTHLSTTYQNGDNEEIKLPLNFVEPEIVYYKKTNSLAIQGHPEFLNCNSKTVDYCLDLIEHFLLKTKKLENIIDYKNDIKFERRNNRFGRIPVPRQHLEWRGFNQENPFQDDPEELEWFNENHE